MPPTRDGLKAMKRTQLQRLAKVWQSKLEGGVGVRIQSNSLSPRSRLQTSKIALGATSRLLSS